MKQSFIETFEKCLDQYFPQIQRDFNLQVEKVNNSSDIEYQMTNKHVQLTVSLHNSHEVYVSTSLKCLGCANRVFGLKLIKQVLNPDFDSGCEDIRTENELDYAVQQQAAAIKQYCADFLKGDFSQWGMFEDYAERKLKEKE